MSLGINLPFASAVVTTYLRIKNIKLYKKIVERSKNNYLINDISSAYEYLLDLVRSNPELKQQVAMIQRETITCGEMIQEINHLSKVLHSIFQCRKGENISICAASSIEGIVAFLQ